MICDSIGAIWRRSSVLFRRLGNASPAVTCGRPRKIAGGSTWRGYCRSAAVVLPVSLLGLAERTFALNPPTPWVFANGEITQWAATDDLVCTLYVDDRIVSWDRQNAHKVGQTQVPHTPGNPTRCEIATDLSGRELGCAYSPTAFDASTLLIASLPGLTSRGVAHLGDRLDGTWENIAQLDCTRGRISYEGIGRYIAGAFDFKTNRELWRFRNPVVELPGPTPSPPPVFAMPDFAGYISVINGKASAHSADGKALWAVALPRPTEHWNAPDRMVGFSRIFVVQDRDGNAGPIAAFDRRNGKLLWQTSVAESGDILATDDSGEIQLFVKDGKYSLRRLPNDGEVACQLSGDQDVRFTPGGRFLLALPSLEYGPLNPATGAMVRSRSSSTVGVIDVKDGKLVTKIGVAEPN